MSDLLQAIIPLFELDSYAPPLVMMAAVEGDALDPQVETRYREALSGPAPCPEIARIDRFAFTSGRKKALRSLSQVSALVHGNILLKRGCA